ICPCSPRSTISPLSSGRRSGRTGSSSLIEFSSTTRSAARGREPSPRSMIEGHAMTELQRNEVLCVPKRRRFVHTKVQSPEGQEILHVYYGDKEIVFDEPDLVPFGERLVQTDRFQAEEAMSWSNEGPHDWEKIRELLQALLDEEIVARVSETTAAP